MKFFLWSKESTNRNALTLKYEPLQPFLFLSFLEHAQVKFAFDVGANVGAYSMMASLVESVENIYSFEPDDAANRELIENVELNGLDKRIVVSDAAVSSQSGSLRFGSHAPMSGVNGVVETSIHNNELYDVITDVNAVRLDDYQELMGKPIGLKIDVEGHELKVIEGAAQLLQNSPCIIQVEHYVGSEIDSLLGQLGYFLFFNAGHDHYFSNIRNFANPHFVKQAVQYASACLIDSQVGRWPVKGTVKHALSAEVSTVGDEIRVNAFPDEAFFSGDLQFAFYLIENGEKADVVDYGTSDCARFELNSDADTIEVKAFVRDASKRSKKAIASYPIKQQVHGFQPEPSVSNSHHVPSSSVSVGLIIFGCAYGYPDIEEPDFTSSTKDRETVNVIQLGQDYSSFNFVKNEKLKLSLYASSLSPDSSQPAKVISSLSSVCEDALRRADILIIRAQFLAEVSSGWGELSQMLNRLPNNCRLYTDYLVDETFKAGLSELAERKALTITWLRPKSISLSFEQSRLKVKSVSYPSISNELSCDEMFRPLDNKLKNLILELVKTDDKGICGDTVLIEQIGEKYRESSSVALVDFRHLSLVHVERQLEIEVKLSSLKGKQTLIVLCHDVDEIQKLVAQECDNFVAESVVIEYGLLVYKHDEQSLN